MAEIGPYVCDECTTAAYDNGIHDADLQVDVCVSMGGEIGDHICENREYDEGGECECACNEGGCI